MLTYTLKVIEVRKETNDTITLCFKQPALKKIKYTAGQYLTLIFRINGRRYIRPYSFSSAPACDANLEITVKRVPQGIVSNHIHDKVMVGNSIEVLPPMGDFICHDTQKQIFLWGIGSGITPLISIAKQLVYSDNNIQVNLIYGNRNSEQTIFASLIHGLKDKFGEKFRVWNFHTRLQVLENPPFLVQGRITEQSVLDIMHDQDIENSLHYICGPFGLKESVKAALAQLKVQAGQIFSEDFELVKDPREFEHIQTENVRLNFLDKEYSLEVIKGKSILEAALDAGIELPYSCQTGSCSTCKGRVESGEVQMIGLSKPRPDILINDCLLCCSYPITKNVCIQI